MGSLWAVRAAHPTSLGHRRAPVESLVLCSFAPRPQPCSLPFSPAPLLLPIQLCPMSFAPGHTLGHLCSQAQRAWLALPSTPPQPSPAPAATPSAEASAVAGSRFRQDHVQWLQPSGLSPRALSPPRAGAAVTGDRFASLSREAQQVDAD